VKTDYHLLNLPHSWDWRRIKHVLKSLESGGRENSKEDRFDGQAFSIGGEHIGWKGEWLLLDNPRFVSFDYFDSMRSGHIQKMDVLLVKDGATIGKTAIADELPHEKMAVNEHVFILRFDVPVFPKFGFYFIQSRIAQEQIYLEVRGSAQPGLNTEFRNKVQFPFSPIEAQIGIANYLDREITEIDTLVTEKEHMLALIEEKRAALINHIFTRGLNPNVALKPSGIDWLGEVPEYWGIRRGKYLFVQSSLPVRENDEIVTCFRDGQVTFRRNRREDGFTNAVLELGYQGIRQGQLILHSMDAFAGAIGVSDSDGKCSPEYIICDPLIDGIDSQYYALLLRVMALRGFIQAACTAVRERAPRIRFSHIANMFLPLPPISEQREIMRTIERETDSTKELVTALTDSISLLKERRSALITAAVTGQIEPEAMMA
jgi:type I restriction enzyme, S subunit